MKSFVTSIATLLAAASLAAAQCAICPTQIQVGNITYYDVASSGGLGAPQFCSYNSNPSGGVDMSQVCWYSGSGGLDPGESWADCPTTTATGPCPPHSN
ncbi:hypothetical protein NEOLEDRAFT_1129607, partial [Neolentinus lepideus HHB14362 ss-1]